MSVDIVKTVITFTVLHRADNVISDLETALYQANEGDAVGWETGCTSELVDPERVVDELVALGNDGLFFDDDDGPNGGDKT